MFRAIVLVAACACLVATSCRTSETKGGPPLVVGSFYPLAWIAEEIGGPDVQVVNMTPPGVEPHDLELTPSQVKTVASADLVVYLGAGFQPAVEELAQTDPGSELDALDGQDLLTVEGDEPDPHLWLDPSKLAFVAEEVSDRLIESLPSRADAIRTRTAALIARLSALDGAFDTGLADCTRREIITSHAAFGYLAARYHLEQIAISGISPEAEPTPQRIAEVAAEARERGATTIFFETLVSPAIAETIAAELGITTAVLDPIESQPENGDYERAMEANLSTLRKALGCR